MQQSKVRLVKKMEINRELARLQIALALNNVLPFGLFEEQILAIVRSIRAKTTALEIRRELEFFAESGLVEIRKDPGRSWFASLTQYAVDQIAHAHKNFHSEWD